MARLPRLNRLDCIERAEECRRMAFRSRLGSHIIMLNHIAETWERLAAEIEHSGCGVSAFDLNSDIH